MTAPLILCDVDGCLGSWDRAFLRLLNGMTGQAKAFPAGEPLMWNWPTEELKFSADEVDRAWRAIENEAGYFWEHDIAPMVGAGHALRRLAMLDHTGLAEVYFVTARRTACARRRTATWLKQAGYDGNPAVITTGLKGKLARVLKHKDQRLVVIDDKPENVEECLTIINVGLYLVDHLYNRNAGFSQVLRVSSVMEALELEFPREMGVGSVAA